MDTGINVRKVTSKNLMEYDKRRREMDATWDDIDWEENDLESGSGSADCETHLKIINCYPAWKELFDLQRRSDYLSNYDMHLIDGSGKGFVPCHRVFLQQKSEFLDRLIAENLKMNTPSDKNAITITLMDTCLENIKTVVTLLYTGSCVVADTPEEDEIKEVLRLLQIDVKRFKFNRERIDPSSLKSKKKKWKTVKAMVYERASDRPGTGGPTENQSPEGPVANDAERSPAVTNAPATTTAATSTTTSTSQLHVPGPSNMNTDSQFPEIRKVPHGTLTQKKPMDRIQRNIDVPTATASSSSANKSNEGNSDEEEDEISRAPLPVVQKVAPGSLLPLHKQPRIVRHIPAKRGRGRGGKRGGSTRQTNTVPDANPEDEDSNGPKGKYERDHEYVPSGESEAVEEDVEMDVDEENMGGESDENESRPCTRNRPAAVAEASGRYPTRRRRTGGSVVGNAAKEKENSKGSQPERLNPVVEDVSEALRGPRTRGKTASPGKKGSTRSSSGNGENEDEVPGHRCTFCGDTFLEIQNLKVHLEETNCAKHLTGTYNILTKYCGTCQTFFKKYSACEFLDHIKVCVCSARPSQKRRRPSAIPASTSSAIQSSSQAPPVQPQNITAARPAPVGTETNFKKRIKNAQNNLCEQVGLSEVSLLVDKLNSKQISAIQGKIRQGLKINVKRANLPVGRTYVFGGNRQTVDPRPSTSTGPEVEQPSPSPRPHHSMATESADATLISVNSSNFNPAFSSTPNSPPTTSSTNAAKKIKGAATDRHVRNRPGPVSAKKRKVVVSQGNAETESGPDPNKGNGEVKKSRGGLVGQKQNEDQLISDKDNVTVLPSNTPANADIRPQVNTTAEKLREKLRNTLHPSSSKGAAVNEKVNSTGENSDIPNVATSSENIPSDTGAEKPPPPISQTTKSPNENSGHGSLPKSFQQPTQQQIPTTSSKTVGSVIQTVVEGMVRKTPDINSTTKSTAVVPAENPTPLSRDTLLQQRIPSAVPEDSQVPETQPPIREQITTTVSLLNPQMSIAGVQSVASLSAVLGTPARPRMSTLPRTQQTLQAPRQQQIYVTSPAPNQIQTVQTQSNVGFSPTSTSLLTPSQQLQLSSQQRMQMFLQSQHSQSHAAQPGMRYDPSIRTTSLVLTSQLQSTQQYPMIQNQQNMRMATIRSTHPNQMGQRPSSLPSSTNEGLEIRRMETSRTVLTGNPENSVIPHNNMSVVAVQQQQGNATQRSSSAPVNITTPQSQLSTVNIHNSQIMPTHNQNGPSGTILQQSLEGSNSIVSVGTQQQRTTHQELIQHQQRQQQLQILSTQSMQSSAMVPQTPVQNAQYSSLNTSLQQPHYSQFQTLPNVILSGMGGGSGQLAHQMSNNTVTCSIATVRLPVTRQMNPLANNRAIQMMASNTQQQSQMLAIRNVPSPQTSTSQLINNRNAVQNTSNLVHSVNNSITTAASGNSFIQLPNQTQNPSIEKTTDIKPMIEFIGPHNKVYSEERIWKCPECNVTFKSEDSFRDHERDGMC